MANRMTPEEIGQAPGLEMLERRADSFVAYLKREFAHAFDDDDTAAVEGYREIGRSLSRRDAERVKSWLRKWQYIKPPQPREFRRYLDGEANLERMAQEAREEPRRKVKRKQYPWGLQKEAIRTGNWHIVPGRIPPGEPFTDERVAQAVAELHQWRRGEWPYGKPDDQAPDASLAKNLRGKR